MLKLVIIILIILLPSVVQCRRIKRQSPGGGCFGENSACLSSTQCCSGICTNGRCDCIPAGQSTRTPSACCSQQWIPPSGNTPGKCCSQHAEKCQTNSDCCSAMAVCTQTSNWGTICI